MKNKILFIVSLLFGLMFINSGLNKFFHYIPVPADLPEKLVNAMNALMEINWLLPLIAVFEIIGGILFIFPKTRALGAIIILPINVGVFLTHLCMAPSGLPIAIVLMLINLWVIYNNRAKYLPMVG